MMRKITAVLSKKLTGKVDLYGLKTLLNKEVNKEQPV
jgi:hypothetical protein